MKRTIIGTLFTMSLVSSTFLFSYSYALGNPTSRELMPIFEGRSDPFYQKSKDFKLHTPLGTFDPLNEPEPTIPQGLKASFAAG